MLQVNVAQIGACETVLLSRPYVINLDQSPNYNFLQSTHRNAKSLLLFV